MNPNKKLPKNAKEFACKECDFICFKKSNFEKHILTLKHKNLKNPNNLGIDIDKKLIICSNCNKIYKHLSTLSAHKKKCKNIEETTTNETEYKMLTALMIEMVKSNSELQKQMMEVCKINTTTINNNSNNNSNNKTFNMQFFLNEQCKDAMNIMDFVNSMTLEFSDLESVGKLGYVEGISGIIIKKLNELDIYKRPIHCSDAKREIMFVKDDNVWEKENSTYDKLRKAIKYVTKKNSDMLIPWSKKYPACMNTSHPLNDTYIQLMGQAMGGKEEFVDSENKIMKKIAKSVLIDKTF
jgi:hypothetical protein